MKRNVDLTDNFDFSRYKIPDEKYYDEQSFYENVEDVYEIFFTGNATQREAKRIVNSFSIQDNFCDKCGDTNPLHFLSKSSLCDKCLVELEEQLTKKYGDKPWEWEMK